VRVLRGASGQRRARVLSVSRAPPARLEHHGVPSCRRSTRRARPALIGHEPLEGCAGKSARRSSAQQTGSPRTCTAPRAHRQLRERRRGRASPESAPSAGESLRPALGRRQPRGPRSRRGRGAHHRRRGALRAGRAPSGRAAAAPAEAVSVLEAGPSARSAKGRIATIPAYCLSNTRTSSYFSPEMANVARRKSPSCCGHGREGNQASGADNSAPGDPPAVSTRHAARELPAMARRVHTAPRAAAHCMDVLAPRAHHRAVRVLGHVKKLDDAFGQFLVRVTCACGVSRHIEPEALARLVGWRVTLAPLAARMRWSTCGRKVAAVEAVARAAAARRRSLIAA
jgi:hypothetical protein